MNLLIQDPLRPNDTAALVRFPLSSSQQRCWFMNALDPGTTALNVALRWKLRGRIDQAAFARALALVIERHEALRTCIVETDGEPVQEIWPPFGLALPEVDLCGLSMEDRTEAVDRLGAEEAHRPFDPSRLPLIRTTLLRTATDEATILVTIHQIAFDGWSIRLISREFGRAAAAIMAGIPCDLPELPLQYGDYTEWQRAHLASGRFERETAFWKAQLAGAPYFEVPGDRPRPPRPTSRGVIVATLLGAETADAMAQFVRRKGVTLFSFGCAVMATALHRRTGAREIVFGTQVSGRDDPDLEDLIGVFINNLVLRFDLSDVSTFDDLLVRANQTVQEALLHQAMPFHRLVEILKPPRDPRRMPLISVNFTVLQDVMEDARYGDVTLFGQPSLSAGSLYDLNFFMVHWPTGWRMALEYNIDLFDAATGAALLALWCETLDRCLNGTVRIAADALPVAAAIQEPGIERALAILRSHPAVDQAAVVCCGAADQNQTHHAFVTVRSDFEGVVDELPSILRARATSQDPESAALAGLSLLMRLPLAADGQVDRIALARLALRAAVADAPDHTQACAGTPDASLAERVKTIWADILGTSDISIQTNFFAAGGHSLLAMRMVRQVEERTGLLSRVGDVFTSPTLGGFVASLGRAAGAQAPGPIVEAQDRASGAAQALAVTPMPMPSNDHSCVEVRAPGLDTAVFGINSIDELYSFARDLGGTRGLYSIQLFEAGGPDPFAGKTFEAIARDYVKIVRRVQLDGPYILFGLCVHGVLALEIAHQLRAAGQTVELLALKKTWHPTYIQRLSGRNRWIVRLSQVRDNFRLVLRQEKSFVSFLANYAIVQKSGLLHLAVRCGLMRAVPSKTGSAVNDTYLLSLMRARDEYRPGRYDGAVIQYLGRDTPRGRGFDPTLGWTGTLTGPLTLRDDPEDMPASATPSGPLKKRTALL